MKSSLVLFNVTLFLIAFINPAYSDSDGKPLLRHVLAPSLGVSQPVRALLGDNLDLNLGVATKICLKARSDVAIFRSMSAAPEANWANVPHDRDWWILPAHVSADHETLATFAGTVLRRELQDDLGDLALYSSPVTASPCITLAREIILPRVYNIEASYNQTQVPVFVNSPDTDSWVMQGHRLETLFGTPFVNGLPGRDETGPLGLFLSFGYRGQSGSAVMGCMADGRTPDFVCDQPSAEDLDYNPVFRLFGMLIAVSPGGRTSAMLPAPTIYRKLQDHFRAPKAFLAGVLPVRGGNQYVDSSAVIWRGNLPNASKGRHDKVILPSVPLLKIGKVEGITGALGDGGAGGNNVDAAVRLPMSGIQLGNRIWLSIGQIWSEFQNLPSSLRHQFSIPESLDGIYTAQTPLGPGFFSTRANTPVVPWLEYPLRDSWIKASHGCVRTQAVLTFTDYLRPLNPERAGTNAVTVESCEIVTQSGREIRIRFNPVGDRHEWGGPIVFTASLDRSEKATALGYPVQLRASANGEPLRSEGLRIFRSENLQIVLDRDGGYVVSLIKAGRSFMIVGPVLGDSPMADI